MTHKQPHQTALDAAGWLAELRADNVSPADVQKFGDWLRDAPANVREYLEALVIWDNLAEVDPNSEIDVDKLLADSTVVSFDDRAGPQHRATEPPRQRRRRWQGLAAGIVVAVAGWWSFEHFYGSSWQISTGPGEHRSVVLQDGSVVHLNIRSDIEITFNGDRRVVHLASGEAYFDVAKDPDRPFFVSAQNALVEVLGTRFNVRRFVEEATEITVLDGLVSVRKQAGPPLDGDSEQLPSSNDAVGGGQAIRLAANQQVRVEAGGAMAHRTVNPQKFVAWTERRLIFEGDTLADIVLEFNRYNTRQLIVDNPQLAAKRLTGVFGVHDLNSFIAYISETHAVSITREQENTIISKSEMD